jgi:hypothetical protein
VRAAVDSGPGSSANVGLRTGPGPGPCAGAAPVLPLACPNTRRFTTADVQQLLGPGLNGIPGFGFKPIRSFTDDGLGDIQVGAKYQYWRSRDVRLAATGGARFPTGRQDDTDDLADISWSSGAYGVFLRSHNDWIVSNLWKGTATPATGAFPTPGDVVLDGTFRYEWVLPDHVTLRVGDANTLTTNRERLYRDLGDRFEVEGSAQYYFTAALSFTSVYRYGFKLEDRFRGHRGFPTQVLSQDTDATEQILLFRLNYSTLDLYRQGRFPLPLDVAVSYRNRFAGSGPRSGGSPSQVLKTEYWSLRLQAVF